MRLFRRSSLGATDDDPPACKFALYAFPVGEKAMHAPGLAYLSGRLAREM